ncbi:MAG: zinc ribbon domain-containing protein [Gemmatimonadota bacterium]|nr:zinc ribbon domain-containing protein [Gemmatimonadota bacterium]
MTDLERLFRRLVDNLIAIDPARLHRPIALSDLLSSVIPYRTTRRALNIDSAEDYDSLILRLTAGEGGYVRMLSEDVAQVMRDQLASPNPDLSVLRDHARAELVLGTEPLAHALGPGPDEAFAPPGDDDYEPLIIPQAGTLTSAAGTSAPPPAPPSQSGAPALPTAPRELRLDSRRPMAFSAEPTPPASPPMVPPPPRMTAEPEPTRTRPRDSGVRCSFCGGRLPAGRAVNFCPHCGQNQSLTRCPGCQAELELGWRHCINCGHVVAEE